MFQNLEAFRELNAPKTLYRFVTGNLMPITGQHFCQKSVGQPFTIHQHAITIEYY